ncbi:MAG: AI-2E family transporter [Oligoflexia bacterium]|nr:AI-2E family transporter [Oligoflexia bacterium]
MLQQKKDISSKVTFILLFILIIILAFKIAAPFLVALIVGGVLALALRPLQRKLIIKGVRPKLSAYLLFIFLIVAGAVPIGFFIKSLISQASTFRDYMSASNVSFGSVLQALARLPVIGHLVSDPSAFDSEINTLAIELGTAISNFALKEATQIPRLIVQTFLALISCLFFLLDGTRLHKFLAGKIPIRDDVRLALMESFKKNSELVILASLFVAATQSIMILICFLVLSIPAAFLASGSAFFLSFIPFIGQAPIWILVSLYLYMKGATVRFIFLVLFVIITSLSDNVIRVFVLKGPKGLNPLVTLAQVS